MMFHQECVVFSAFLQLSVHLHRKGRLVCKYDLLFLRPISKHLRSPLHMQILQIEVFLARFHSLFGVVLRCAKS